MRAERRDLALWAALVAVGFALTEVAVALDARLGVAGAPFTGDYRIKITWGTLLAPAVAATVLLGVRRGVHDRLPWRWLLVAGFVAAFCWAVALALVDGGSGLARPLELSRSYLSDAPRVRDGFLRHYVDLAPQLSVDSRQHPPGGVLLLWALTRLGMRSVIALGLTVTAIGCASVPLVAIAVRSLCHESAARRLVPVLALAPYAVWLAVSMDAVVLTVCAAAIACGVRASERGRTVWWAMAAGGLLGVGALFSYSAAWLGASLVVVYFVRRRPWLNVLSGVGVLLPLTAGRLAGFVWPDGLTAAQVDFSERIGPHRSWLLWAFLDVLLTLVACGPVLLAATRKLRRTPGWPFLVGAALAVGFAIGSGLSRGEVERSFLPFFPWLLVPAVAPEPAQDRSAGAPTPLLLAAAGATTAVVVEAVLRTAW